MAHCGGGRFEPTEQSKVTTLRQELRQAIENSVMPSYVYTYPPRQVYRPLPKYVDDEIILEMLSETPNNFNLYIHFPFCKQICRFCTLFTTVGQENLLDDYIVAIGRELEHYSKALGNQKLRTIYLGGGTPSLLDDAQLQRVFALIEAYFPDSIGSCDEVCIEADPATLTLDKARLFKSLGVNRVNLGVQTFNEDELTGIGRRYVTDVSRRAIDLIRQAQIENLCVDLINGLLGQTRDAWLSSVSELAQFKPETFCIYPLTVRPATGYFQYVSTLRDFKEIYTRYDLARPMLINNGYSQETHIRFIIPGKGGYKQKEYHWEGATVLGLGAGARTYAPRIHFRNGYGSRNRTDVLRNYLANIAAQGHSRIDGFVFDPEEQIRREFALNLHKLDRGNFRMLYDQPFEKCFPTQIRALEEEGMLCAGPQKVEFTEKGLKYRDLISRLFFSARVVQLEAGYTYDD